MTEHDLAKLSSFHTTSIRKIQGIFWSRTISNHNLLAQCQQKDMETIITRKQWCWIGHVLRKDANSITKVAIHWTPEGKRTRGRPKTTWRRTVESEMNNMNHSWSTIQRLASDRQRNHNGKRSKIHDRLKERFLMGQNRTNFSFCQPPSI